MVDFERLLLIFIGLLRGHFGLGEERERRGRPKKKRRRTRKQGSTKKNEKRRKRKEGKLAPHLQI